MSQGLMKVGYPYLEVRFYPDYVQYTSDNHYNLTEAVISLNLEYSMDGKSNGLLQVYDEQNVLKFTGDEIIYVSVADYRQSNRYTLIFGVDVVDMAVLESGSGVKTIMLVPFHNRESRRFNKKFDTNVQENLLEMVSDLYIGYEDIMPLIDSENIFIPTTLWVRSFDTYLEFIRKYGQYVDTDMFIHAWYDMRGIHLKPHNMIMEQEPKKLVVVQEDYLGEMAGLTDHDIIATSFVVPNLSKQRFKKKYLNTNFVSLSSQNKDIYNNRFGTGESVEFINRSGNYEGMTYVNGFEEINRITTMAQYDTVTQFKTYGNFSVHPCDILEIDDEYELANPKHIVSKIIHEISNETSFTTIETISNYDELEEFDYVKEISSRYEQD